MAATAIPSAHMPITAQDGCQDPVLLNDWHVVGFASDFVQGSIYPVRLLERDLIAWRSADDAIHVWEDLCIHRGARLSKGWIRNDRVVCPYHGWQYNGAGACTLMPAAPDETPMKKARAFPYRAVERYGFIWVCLGEPAADIPVFPEWEDASFLKVHSGPYDYAANGFRAIENFVDASHFPFVHAGLNGVMDTPDKLDPYEVHETEAGLQSSEVKVFQPVGDARGIPLMAFYTYCSEQVSLVVRRGCLVARHRDVWLRPLSGPPTKTDYLRPLTRLLVCVGDLFGHGDGPLNCGPPLSSVFFAGFGVPRAPKVCLRRRALG